MSDQREAEGGAVYNAAVEFVDRNIARGRGAKPAFIDPQRTLTYAGLKERSDRFATTLGRLGIGRERRIAMIMLDTVDFPVVFWGAIRAGVVPIPLNTLMTPEQWRYIITDSRAEMIVISAALAKTAMPLLEECMGQGIAVVLAGGEPQGGMHGLEFELAASAPTGETADTSPDEVAFWLYSSGSTGMPKGVRHVHTSLAYTAHLYGRDVLGIREDDVVFSAAKLFFAYGLGNALTFPMSVGATTVLWPERPTPDAVLDIIAKHQPTIFYGVPTLYGSLLASPKLGQGAGSQRLRACVSAGEALPEDIGNRWKSTVGVDILDGIGSTEMLHIFVSNRSNKIRYGSSGIPVPGYEARLLDDDGRPVPPGEVGELVVAGPSAAEGYWNQREKSRRTFAGVWTYTGDKYRIDEDGFYHYCGRADDMFKVSGIWLSPFTVESALISHPAVLEAAVVPKADDEGLLKPKAFVVLAAGAKFDNALGEELREHVKNTSGNWSYPRWIEPITELPKTATGKIQRYKLRDEA